MKGLDLSLFEISRNRKTKTRVGFDFSMSVSDQVRDELGVATPLCALVVPLMEFLDVKTDLGSAGGAHGKVHAVPNGTWNGKRVIANTAYAPAPSPSSPSPFPSVILARPGEPASPSLLVEPNPFSNRAAAPTPR